MACVGLTLVTLFVHYMALCEDRTDLLLPHLISSMETKCRTLGKVFESNVTMPPLHPVPTQFGVAVWVENERWSLPVHETLDRIENAIGSFASPGAKAKGGRVIQRLVHLAAKESNAGNDSLLSAAMTQQVGLGVAQHVYAYDLAGELRMHGISFFSSSSALAGRSGVECFVFAERKAYCIIPEDASTEWLSREIPAAIASLMSGWLSLESFRDLNVIRQWALERDSHSCHYAIRALRQLERSVEAHPDMPAPEDVAETISHLRSLIESGEFAYFARAADDLQFHPLFLPQLYIPWDQALVNHLSILLPVISTGMIGVRTLIAEFKRIRGKRQAEQKATFDDNKKQ